MQQDVKSIRLNLLKWLVFTPALFLLISFSVPLGKSTTSNRSSISAPFSFINFDDNQIVFKPSEFITNRFDSIIERAVKGEEPVSILHIGDSHIQADMFTGETRRLIAQWLSETNPSRGYTFPYQLANTNNPSDFETTSTGTWRRERVLDISSPHKLGLLGMALISNDSVNQLTIRLKKKWSLSQSFDLVKLYFEDGGNNTQFSTSLKGKSVENIDGVWAYRLDNPCDSISFQIKMSPERFDKLRIYGIELLNYSSKFVYHSVGLNGAEVKSFLLSENMNQQVALLNPQVVIISLGTNDAFNNGFNASTFRKNLRELVGGIKKSSPEAIIILTTPGDHLIARSNENPSLEQVQDEIYRVANELDCGVWDFNRIMGGTGSIRSWSEMGLSAPDMLHLSRNGYKLQGALFFSALAKLSGYNPDNFHDNELAQQ